MKNDEERHLSLKTSLALNLFVDRIIVSKWKTLEDVIVLSFTISIFLFLFCFHILRFFQFSFVVVNGLLFSLSTG